VRTVPATPLARYRKNTTAGVGSRRLVHTIVKAAAPRERTRPALRPNRFDAAPESELAKIATIARST
jgi:hypothetical protein